MTERTGTALLIAIIMVGVSTGGGFASAAAVEMKAPSSLTADGSARRHDRRHRYYHHYAYRPYYPYRYGHPYYYSPGPFFPFPWFPDSPWYGGGEARGGGGVKRALRRESLRQQNDASRARFAVL